MPEDSQQRERDEFTPGDVHSTRLWVYILLIFLNSGSIASRDGSELSNLTNIFRQKVEESSHKEEHDEMHSELLRDKET